MKCVQWKHSMTHPPDKPSKPNELTAADIWKDYIVVKWKKPTSDGGTPILKWDFPVLSINICFSFLLIKTFLIWKKNTIKLDCDLIIIFISKRYLIEMRDAYEIGYKMIATLTPDQLSYKVDPQGQRAIFSIKINIISMNIKNIIKNSNIFWRLQASMKVMTTTSEFTLRTLLASAIREQKSGLP